ncbi:hypothetical protein BGX34_007084 [Mortierella sp. NVP85]|nr:hypothetical protein BGX34_007084 [Mortierella sp. NVP85]
MSTPLQEFRAESSSEIVTIPTFVDPVTKEHIVRWKDIRQRFENVKYVLNGTTSVLLLTNSWLEERSMPMIAYYPDVVLTVVLKDDDQNSSKTDDSIGDDQSILLNSSGDATITETNTHGQVPVTPLQPIEIKMSLHTPCHRCSTCSHEAPAPTQRHSAESSHQSTDEPSAHKSLGVSNDSLPSVHQLQLQIDQIGKSLKEVQQSYQQMHQQQQKLGDILHQLQQPDPLVDQLSLQQHQLIDILQQQRQNIDTILQNTQQTGEQVHQQQQQIDNILQRIRGVDQNGHDASRPAHKPDCENVHEAPQQQIRKDVTDIQEILQRQRQEFDRILVVKSRAQAMLARSFQELSVPRLFIVLPKTTGLVDQDGRWCSFQFRLYYLCECGTHAMGDDSKAMHEIHLAQHSGYDLRNHGAFFDKFGPHLLMMMYLVKYGATSAGRFIPPLSDFKVDADQGQLHFPKGDLSRLVDDMITYLEDTIRANNNGKDPTSNWELNSSELTQLKSYLEVEEDENVFGNLCQTITRDRHCVWMCSNHQHEYYKSTLVWVKGLVIANGDEYTEHQGKITIRLKYGIDRLLEAMRMVCWIQGFNKQWPMRAHDSGSMAMSASYILIDRNATHSLVLEYGKYTRQFTLSASITEDGTCNMEIKIDSLSNLTPDILASISRCQHSKLMIRRTPMESDDVHLINIIQHSAKLEVLRIGCLANRSLAVVNLILSIRDQMLQNGTPLPLRTFELMDEELSQINDYNFCDSQGHIASTMKFSKAVKTFDMSTNIKFPISSSAFAPLLDFAQSYGWSIETLTASSQFGDNHARLIRGAIQDRRPQIATLNIVPYTITTDGLDALDEIIGMSSSNISIGMRCHRLGDRGILDKVGSPLMRYKAHVYHLSLGGSTIENWLPQIANFIPARDVLPKMSALTLEGEGQSTVPKTCIPWIIAMISAPPQPPSATALPEPLTRLRRLTISNVRLEAEDWKSVIRAIDLTELEWLDFKVTNFSQVELELLVYRIVDNVASQARLKTLCIDKKLLEQEAARALRATLQKKAPLVQFD